ncbi:multidrug effflux MFS transporter [Streptomyces sulphureus]|uniref:multidrug effflux MFS transporter n=1 Tax=Streptomyces sulphureus TaxID=47758 RepID=UPI000688EB01|nr:multidrug effflux MFS transporter [Streptomyces sulphureus]
MVTTRIDAGSPERRSPARSMGLLAVLGALTAVGPLAIDMYVPGFPSMGASLHTGSSSVQLTMTAFLAGLVAGQLVFGPMSDSLGRRRLLLCGCVGFAVLSAACAFAPTAQVLVAARFFQGAAGAIGMVLARAVLTDLFAGPELPRYFAVLSQILGVAPIAAPVLGGAVLSVAEWRAIFVFLAAVGVALLLAVVWRVPETLPTERRRNEGIAATFRAMGRLAGNRAYLGYVLVLGFSSGAMFSYVGGSSFVFEKVHGVTSGLYSLIFASNALGLLLSGGVFGRLSRRFSVNSLLSWAVAVSIAAALAQLVLVLTLGETLAGTWLTLFVTLFGVGTIFPASMSLGQSVGRDAPGAASALLGGVQFLLGAVGSPLVGFFGEGSSTPMAAVMLGALCLAALALLTLARPWRLSGETAPH